MIPALATLLLAQMIHNRWVERDESFLFFLWIGIFSVFSASFNYLVYAVVVLVYFFLQQSSDNSFSLKAILKTLYEQRLQMFFTAIVSIALFVFFPRFQSFLPSANFKSKGQVGYSQKVDNSNTANLQLSSQVAFYAELPTPMNQETLYWRGRVHTGTDGYNWYNRKIKPKPGKGFNYQNYIEVKMKYEQDFGGDVLILDHPYKIAESNARYYTINPTDEIKFYRKKKKAILTAYSINKNQTELEDFPKDKQYLQLPPFLPKELKGLAARITGSNAKDIIKQFANYLNEEGYTYTLSPGFMPTLKDFMTTKKGYCTHFASLLGLILRIKEIPTQLVSGFQGGAYNEAGEFYTIKSNDAHTWVEYFDQGRWKRVDPTGFVSPGRIRLGGTNFMQSEAKLVESRERASVFTRFYNQFKLQLDNINYKVSLFFDNFNRDKQRDLSKVLKVDRKFFFILGFVLIALILGLYVFLNGRTAKKEIHPVDKLLIKLDQKLNLEKKLTSQMTIAHMRLLIQESKYSDETKKQLLKIILIYQEARYKKSQDKTPLEREISQLKVI